VVWASLTNSSVPSSSVTETTDTPTQAGSPASSHTSLSVASTKDGKDVGLSKEVDVMSAEETPSDIPVSAEKTPHRHLRHLRLRFYLHRLLLSHLRLPQ
jgi:ubiquitin carboxyl-terminal hydrolase 10